MLKLLPADLNPKLREQLAAAAAGAPAESPAAMPQSRPAPSPGEMPCSKCHDVGRRLSVCLHLQLGGWVRVCATAAVVHDVEEQGLSMPGWQQTWDTDKMRGCRGCKASHAQWCGSGAVAESTK